METDKGFVKTLKISKNFINAEKFDLDKIGWTSADGNDEKYYSYIRGYFWRNFKVRIKPPLDEIIFCVIDLALSSQNDLDKK